MPRGTEPTPKFSVVPPLFGPRPARRTRPTPRVADRGRDQRRRARPPSLPLFLSPPLSFLFFPIFFFFSFSSLSFPLLSPFLSSLPRAPGRALSSCPLLHPAAPSTGARHPWTPLSAAAALSPTPPARRSSTAHPPHARALLRTPGPERRSPRVPAHPACPSARTRARTRHATPAAQPYHADRAPACSARARAHTTHAAALRPERPHTPRPAPLCPRRCCPPLTPEQRRLRAVAASSTRYVPPRSARRRPVRARRRRPFYSAAVDAAAALLPAPPP